MNNALVKHSGKITQEMRENFLNQKGCAIWLTGLSGAGKSTIAYELEKELYDKNILSYVLDGDNIRHGLNKDLGFSTDDRKENIRRIAEVSSLFIDAGILTIVSFISPFIRDRETAKEIISKDRFIEVYIKASLEICEQRDPKGMYRKVRSGLIANFTGISSPYEPPVNPDMAIDTEILSVSQSVHIILDYLTERGIIS